MAQLDDYSLLEKIAYHHWVDRGCPAGSPEVDWEFAERQLLSRGRPHQGEGSLEHYEVGHVEQESTSGSIIESGIPGSEPADSGVRIQSDVGLAGNSADMQPSSRRTRTSQAQTPTSRSRSRADGKAIPKPSNS